MTHFVVQADDTNLRALLSGGQVDEFTEKVHFGDPRTSEGDAEARRQMEQTCLAREASGVRRALQGHLFWCAQVSLRLSTTEPPELGKDCLERHEPTQQVATHEFERSIDEEMGRWPFRGTRMKTQATGSARECVGRNAGFARVGHMHRG